MSEMEAVAATPETGDAVTDTSNATTDTAEQSSEGQTAVASQGGSGESKQEPIVRKIKVAGQLRDVSIEELERRYTLEEGAQTKFERAAQMLKEAQALQESLKKDPVKALLNAGITLDQLRSISEKTILEQIEEERLTPEQRRIRELESQLNERQTAEERAAQEKQQQETAEQEKKYVAEFTSKLRDAFSKHQLPVQDPLYVSSAVKFLQNAYLAGEDIDPTDAVEFVKHETLQRVAGLYEGLSGEQIIEHLGQANIEKIRKADIARLKGQPKEGFSATSKTPVPAKDQASVKRSADDFFDTLTV